MSAPNLLSPTTLGGLSLRNRIVMGSMTRNRCIDDGRPTQASADHYAVRARDGTGLIIAEGTFVCDHGAEWPHAPVMYDQSHATAWKRVTDAVHDAGGLIFFQPWHPGRIQHEDMPRLKASGQPVLAPSAVPAAGGKFRELPGSPGHSQHVTAIDDVNRIVEQYRTAARLAKDAGFDGIELLSQGGYLLHNFLCSHSNLRTDDYGGSVENRCRFPLQVLDAILDVWPASLVGIKICPSDDYNDSCVSYEELSETYTYYIKQLMSRQLGYINLSRRGCTLGRVQDDDYFVEVPRPKGKELPRGYEPIHQFGALVKYPGSPTQLMVNHEYSTEEAEQLLAEGKVDLVTFGRPFIYNPDLVSRIKTGAELALNTRGKNVNYGPYGKPDDFYNDWPTASL